MKIRITKTGIYGADGAIPVGTVFPVKGDKLPAGWAGKYEIITDEPAADAQPVTNPASAMPSPRAATTEDIATMTKDELLDALASAGWDGDKRLGVERLREAALELIEG